MGRGDSSKHIPVLLNEVLEYMDLKGKECVVDGTINGGGHSYEIARRLSKEGTLIGIDVDASALAISRERLAGLPPKVILINGNFREMDTLVRSQGIEGVDRVLLDLGWSSNQFENPERGFSFLHDGPLSMTLSLDKGSYPFTAWNVVNEWSEDSLTEIIRSYGEERFARRIARAIVRAREEGGIERTTELAEIIAAAIPQRFHRKGIHPATRTFQAIRIAVNDELGALRDGLEAAFSLLNSGGRLLVISFHSLEDRIVKRFMRARASQGQGRLLTKKPIRASEEEKGKNPPSRSALLRVIERSFEYDEEKAQ